MNIDYTFEEQSSPVAAGEAQTTETRIEVEEVEVRPQAPEASEGQTKGPMRTLYRHPTDKMIGGVCGGLGDFFGLDPTLIRLFWVVMRRFPYS